MGNTPVKDTLTVNDIIHEPGWLTNDTFVPGTMGVCQVIATEHPVEVYEHHLNGLREKYSNYVVRTIAPTNLSDMVSYGRGLELAQELYDVAIGKGMFMISNRPSYGGSKPPREGSTCIVCMFEIVPVPGAFR